jgi:F-type H+-transporting ATPase subunit alpha
MEEQVVALYAGINGYLDEIPVEQVPRFLETLIEALRAESSVLKDIRESGDLTEETETKLTQEIEKVVRGFTVEEREALVS